MIQTEFIVWSWLVPKDPILILHKLWHWLVNKMLKENVFLMVLLEELYLISIKMIMDQQVEVLY
jgi:hypothetical protein